MGRPPRLPVLRHALEVRAAIRADYQGVLEAQVAAADTATRGIMLSPRAPEYARPDDLWLRNLATARAWASEELLDHWRTATRVTWADYQAAVLAGDPTGVLDHAWGEAIGWDW